MYMHCICMCTCVCISTSVHININISVSACVCDCLYLYQCRNLSSLLLCSPLLRCLSYHTVLPGFSLHPSSSSPITTYTPSKTTSTFHSHPPTRYTRSFHGFPLHSPHPSTSSENVDCLCVLVSLLYYLFPVVSCTVPYVFLYSSLPPLLSPTPSSTSTTGTATKI